MVKETNWKPFPVEAPAFHEERHHYGHTKSSWLKTRQLPGVFDFDHPHVFKPGFCLGHQREASPHFGDVSPGRRKSQQSPRPQRPLKLAVDWVKDSKYHQNQSQECACCWLAPCFSGTVLGELVVDDPCFLLFLFGSTHQSFKPRWSQAWGYVGLPKAFDPFGSGEFWTEGWVLLGPRMENTNDRPESIGVLSGLVW